MRFLLILVLLLPVLGLTQSPVIPAPLVYESSGDTLVIAAGELCLPKIAPQACKDFLDRERAWRFSEESGLEGRIILKKRTFEQPGSYELVVGHEIRISYDSDTSCFYALNTLLQLISERPGGTLALPKVYIKDYPRFQWRGLHLDVSRHFFTVDEIKRYIDLMAYYKFNTFHWHLTDDQGWRIEIKKYPELTKTGAWRNRTLSGHYTAFPRTYAKERYGGFYTQEEVREVVRYAQERYITVVPEIEMPGHARAALAAYPGLGCTGEQLGVEGLWGVFDDIFCTKPETIAFLQDVLDEVLELFPSEYIHIGGDEAPKTRWKACPACQKRIRENGLKDEHELQSWFIRQMDAYLTKRGRRLIGWDEILEGGLSPNATVMSWRGLEGGTEAARQGHDVVMTPGAYCYFDHYQGRAAGEPLAIGGFTPIRKVYSFEPVPKELTESQARHIIGAQANLWTEYISRFSQVEYMVYPRALALSQVLWCVEKPSWDAFKTALIEKQLPFLDRLQVNYSRAMFQPEMTIRRTERGKGIFVSWQQEIPKKLNYTVSTSKGVSEPIPVSSTGLYIAPPSAGTDSLLVTLRPDSPPLFETTYRFTVHQALGAQVGLLTQPHPRYSNSGGLTLVDGIQGTIPWRGNEWLGFDTSDILLIVDLGEEKLCAAIAIGTLQDTGSWIHKPLQLELSFSEDAQTWTKPVKRPYAEQIFLDKPLRARFVKIRLLSMKQIPDGLPGAGNQPWTFIDEIRIQ